MSARRTCGECQWCVPCDFDVAEYDAEATKKAGDEARATDPLARVSAIYQHHPAGYCHESPPRTIISESSESFTEKLDTPHIRLDRPACSRFRETGGAA